MTDWLFTWKGIVLCAVALLGAVAFGIVFREGTLGNIASIVGFAVSVLGFIVTIWTVREARQQIKDAGDRAEKAITEASEATRRAVGGIAAQLRAADCAILRSGIEDLRQAAQDAKWTRAVYRCQECRLVAYRLMNDQHLTSEETFALNETADDLQLILRFIEKNRLAGQVGLLKDSHLQSLDGAVGLLARIQARFHYEPLRSSQ
jgi:hypothetical protein